MDSALGIIGWITANYASVLGGVVTALSGIIAVSMMIPGKQPEKFLKSVVDVLSKFSKK